MSQRSHLGLNMPTHPRNTVGPTSSCYLFADARTIRRCDLYSSFRTSHCGIKLAICNQGSTREARRNLRRSALASDCGNVCFINDLMSPNLRVNSNRRLEMDWILPLSNMSGSGREGRRLLDRSLRAAAYRHMIEEKTHMFLAKLLASPEDFRHDIELSVLCFRSIVK